MMMIIIIMPPGLERQVRGRQRLSEALRGPLEEVVREERRDLGAVFRAAEMSFLVVCFVLCVCIIYIYIYTHMYMSE